MAKKGDVRTRHTFSQTSIWPAMWGRNMAFLARLGEYWACLETEGLLERYCIGFENKEMALASALSVKMRL